MGRPMRCSRKGYLKNVYGEETKRLEEVGNIAEAKRLRQDAREVRVYLDYNQKGCSKGI